MKDSPIIRQCIEEAIERINKRLKKINELLNGNYLSEICELRIEFQKMLEENKGDQRNSPEFDSKVKEMAIKEKELFKKAKEQQSTNTETLIDEKVSLEFQLHDLKTELYRMEMRK